MIKYRGEIDGLRAIAVFSVIFYHANIIFNFGNGNFQFFSGGFFGVDIFFVISGYLITNFILSKIKKNQFSYLNFYERRLRRLLPALFFIVIISFITGWILMMPSQFERLSASILSLLFFVSNIWFFFQGSYLSGASELKPLLHTWSLSVEEQFYILFPFFLLYINKLKKIIPVFLALTLIYLLFSFYGSIKFEDANFYFIFSRIWELLIGSLVAQVTQNKLITKMNIYKGLLSFIGLSLIFFALFYYDDSIRHPSYFTFIPVIGTSMILLFYDDSNLLLKILKNKVFIFFGLISYSLYLWHFPILAFNKIKSGGLSFQDKIDSIILTIILSIITYYLIEKPFRNFKIIKTKVFFISLSITLIFLISFSSYGLLTKGVPKRFSSEIRDLITFNYNFRNDYSEGKCFIDERNLKDNKPFKNCNTFKGNNKKNIYLWGDSLAAHLIPGLKESLKEFNLTFRTAATCLPIINNSDKCEKINSFIFNEIKKSKVDYLILSGAWGQVNNDLSEIKNLEKTIIELNKHNIEKIYLVGPSIRWSKPLPRLIIKYYRYKRNIPKYLFDDNHSSRTKLDGEYKKIAKKYNLIYLSPINFFCRNNECLTMIDKNSNSLVTWDESHFTKISSIFFIEGIKNKFK